MAAMMTVTAVPSNIFAADIFTDAETETSISLDESEESGAFTDADIEVDENEQEDVSDADIEVEGDTTDTDSDISDEAEIEAEESGDSEGTAVFSDDTEVGGGEVVSDGENTVVANGSCGASSTWELTSDGVLTISGTGDMQNYASGDAPWYQYMDTIKAVKIDTGINKIGKCSFYGCTSLETLELPEGLTEIDSSSFTGCKKLKNINFPESLTKVNFSAFKNCSSLTEVTISDKVTVGNSAFFGCKGLKKAVVNCKIISKELFSGCTELEEIKLGENVTELNTKAFTNTGVKSITIPESVTKVSDRVFYQCTKLEEATVNSISAGNTLFYNCTALKKVYIGSKLTEINPKIFSGCTSLEELNLAPDNRTLKIVDSAIYSTDGKVLQMCVPGKQGVLTIPNGVEEIAENAFQDCTRLEKIVLPSTINGLSASAFTGCISLKEIVFSGEDGNYKVQDGIVYTTDGKIVFCLSGISGEITVPEGVTELSDYAFRGCKDITKVKLPSTLTVVGAGVFSGCSSLETVVIPESVTKIGSGAFSSCSKLQSIQLPKGLTELAGGIFSGCSSIKEIKLPDGITSIGSSAFANCTSLKTITIPVGVTSFLGGIGYGDNGNTFYGCTSLEKIELPEGVTELPSQAFRECNSLAEIVLPSTLTAVGYNVFSNPDITIHFGGSGKQWKAIQNISILSFVTPDYYYGAAQDDSIIVTQPEKADYKKGEDASSTPLKMVVKAPEDSIPYEFVWYRISKDDTDTVSGEVVEKNTEVSEDGTTATCVPDTADASHYYYFCVAAKKNADTGLTIARSQNTEVAVALNEFKGSGTEENPYQINNVDDLQTLYKLVADGDTMQNLHFQMMADIVLPDDWKSVGILPEDKENPNMPGQDRGTGANIKPFSGIFDGNGKTLTVARGGQPLFGYVRNATVKNLNIQGEYIAADGLVAHYVVDYGPDGNYNTGNDGGSYVSGCPDTVDIINVTIKSGTTINGSGFLGGYASGANTVNIQNCTVESGVKLGWNADENAPSGRDYVGSLAGEFNGTVLGCNSSAEVYGNKGIGGLIGAKGQSMGTYEIRNSSFSGVVSAAGEYAGGIAGQGYNSSSAPNTPGATVENCFVTGSVSGEDCVGGIIGGEPAQAQAWNESYIRNNHFAGTVNGAGSRTGGIIGYLRSVNKCNIIENNYYLDTCGASRGIGNILYVDTSARTHGWTEDNSTYYMNTSTDDLSVIKNETDPSNQYTCISKTGYNRTDDPLGEDAEKLAKAMSAAQFQDNTVVDLLNASDSSMHNWEQGASCPVFGQGAVAYKMNISGEYKTEYYIGDKLDLSGLKVTVFWSDGKQTQPNPEDLKVTGFDSDTRGIKTLTLEYGAAKAQIKITVLKNLDGEINVSFTLLGDKIHNSDEDQEYHTLAAGNLETWISENTYKVSGNATVLDVIAKVLTENEYSWENVKGNYISSVTKPDRTKLAEFTNGQNSGWMYTLNGSHPELAVNEQYLEDGDTIVFHYTDDYTKEHDHVWSSEWTFDENAHWHECTYQWSKCDITDNTKKNGYAAHTFDEGKVTKEPTCKEAGEKLYTCTVCGATKTEKIAKTDKHTYDKGVVTKKATYTATGVKTYTCTVCGATKTETIPKLKHTPKYVWKTVSKATVFQPEKQVGYCVYCKHTQTRYHGSKLKATIKLNTTAITLQRKQATKRVRVSMANGDSIRSWVSTNTRIVTVDRNGLIRAQNRNGSAKIIVTLKSGKRATLNVKVQSGKVTTTKISGLKSSMTLKKGQKTTLKPVISPLTSTDKVTYATSNKNIATVSSAGIIVAKKKGTAKITVRSGKKSYVIKVTVK